MEATVNQKAVLVVDDDLTLLEMYQARLKEEGYIIQLARNGEEALGIAKKNRPNVILLDIMMPGLNGLDVLRQLKDDPETKDIPVIVLTALIEAIKKDEAIAAGAVGYIVKSESMPQDVVAKIKEVLAEVDM